MKYLTIYPDDTLVTLTQRVGSSNIDQVLSDNGLKRAPNIGQQWQKKCEDIKKSNPVIEVSTKINKLNSFIPNSDIYEIAALSSEDTWKVLAVTGAMENLLYISESVQDSIVNSSGVFGNGIPVSESVYMAVNKGLQDIGSVDSSVFSDPIDLSALGFMQNSSSAKSNSSSLSTWFKIPTTEVMLYSSMDDEAVAIPSYPESISDARVANYGTMPDLIYQYEPWQLYESSGPRTNTYSFHLHRDLWTGNHLDGAANNLIRFCQAQLYPRYQGSCVNLPTVTLYISGENEMTGILTNVNVDWKGPLGQDGWYLEFDLQLTITEVSREALSYDVMRNRSQIG